FKGKEKEVLNKAKKLKTALKDFRTFLDGRNTYSAGWKFNEWELKGVPIRIEIGPKDIKKEQVVVVRRDTRKKEFIKIKDLKKKIRGLLEDIHKNLYKKAKDHLKENIIEVDSWKDFLKGIKNKKIVVAPFCNDPKCLDYIKFETGGAKSLNILLKQVLKKNQKCIKCGKKAKVLCRFGKSY
ncbi:MAG: His/Gly/Thr/Pro-type tRNA ligase C-terminal domain-containing protein, partial [Nanoarchaeota archaeon]|nr:His/Gly/Thr/Pro-type tRNA ligase C-terminal domain-containing protein [Nanoarchaeota archaeon]